MAKYVALSGGVDSVVLLYKLHREQVRAIHVNHNIHADSAQWAEFCAELCSKLGVQLIIEQVHAADNEQALRRARYQAFSKHLQPGDTLYTAHHRNDDVETQLMGLLQSKTGHLKGIPAKRNLNGAIVERPLLNLSKQQIVSYAKRHKLEWVDDPSNQTDKYLRNRLRSAAEQLVEQNHDCGQRLKKDIATLEAMSRWAIAHFCDGIPVEFLSQVGPEYVLDVLSEHQFDRKALEEFWRQLIAAPNNSNICLAGAKGTINVYQAKVFYTSHESQQKTITIDTDTKNAHLDSGVTEALVVRTRRPGDKIWYKNKAYCFKKWCHEHNIPSWQRNTSPVVAAGKLIFKFADK